MTDKIELTERQRERIEAIKQECKGSNPNIPAPTDEHIISSLLDTWDAVSKGHYREGYTHNDELRELIEQWRKEQEEYPDTIEGAYGAAAVRACADELESVIDGDTDD